MQITQQGTQEMGMEGDQGSTFCGVMPPACGEGTSHVTFWRKGVPGRGTAGARSRAGMRSV